MIDNKTILKAFNFRHACKVFDESKKISDEDFETILESARLSPSSFGFEPWKFLVVQDKQKREALLPVTWGAQKILPTCSHYVIILARKQKSMRYDSEYLDSIMRDIHHLSPEKVDARRAKFKEFQENDFKLLESERATFDWACKQCYIALANMMTVASLRGIDSCAVEGFDAKKLEKVMQQEFDIDTDEFGVAVMVGFGYRIKEQPKKTRQELEDIAEWFVG